MTLIQSARCPLTNQTARQHFQIFRSLFNTFCRVRQQLASALFLLLLPGIKLNGCGERYSWLAHRGSRGHGCKYSVETCGQSVGCWSYASCFCSVTKWSRRIDGPYNVPRFSSLADSRVYVSAITIGIIASLESLTELKQLTRLILDSSVPRNRELLAQGAGNVICGLFGGLPVSAAIQELRMSMLRTDTIRDCRAWPSLLTCVLLLPAWLNEIPLSTLAAILIKTGTD